MQRKITQTTGNVGTNPNMVKAVAVIPQNDAEHRAMLNLQERHKDNVCLNKAHSYVPYGGGEPVQVPATFNCRGMYGVSHDFGVPRPAGLTKFGEELNQILVANGAKPV